MIDEKAFGEALETWFQDVMKEKKGTFTSSLRKAIETYEEYRNKHPNDLVFKSGDNKHYRLESAGRWPDGTISPSFKLDIKSTQNTEPNK